MVWPFQNKNIRKTDQEEKHKLLDTPDIEHWVLRGLIRISGCWQNTSMTHKMPIRERSDAPMQPKSLAVQKLKVSSCLAASLPTFLWETWKDVCDSSQNWQKGSIKHILKSYNFGKSRSLGKKRGHSHPCAAEHRQSFPIICLAWQAPCRQSLHTAAAQLLDLSNPTQPQGVEVNMR